MRAGIMAGLAVLAAAGCVYALQQASGNGSGNASATAAPPTAMPPPPGAGGAEAVPPGFGIRMPDGSEGKVVTSLGRSGDPVRALPEAMAEADGYRLASAPDYAEPMPPDDFGPSMFFEVFAPPGSPAAAVERASASCSCLRAESVAPAPDGRTLIRVRRLREPPAAGDGFVLSVRLTRPEGIILQRTIPK